MRRPDIPLRETLGLRPGQILAAVGGGGKTRLLEQLAAECRAAGWAPVLLTTTTKMFAPENGAPLLLGEAGLLSETVGGMNEAAIALARARVGPAPVPGAPGQTRMKLDGFEAGEIESFRREAGMVLVEGDGARGLPIKAPGPGEPVVPPGTDVVLGVIGLDAVGTPIDEAHAFRPALLAAVAGQPPGSPITAETLGRLAAHPAGLFKGAPPQARRILIINKSDLCEELEKTAEIAYIVWNLAGAPRGPVSGMVFTSRISSAVELSVMVN
ncbi:MAG: selenium cofactor biosynthesis protein YqeC [bacterium]|nr:selenium cofactor biosynthesis protein YqeC [bacterium]